MVELMGSLPQGTVTFLFTDIEGSTRLLDRLGRDHYGQLLEQQRQLLRGAVAAGGGAEVDATGDALLAVFSSAGGAVAAAVAAQRLLAEQQWPAKAEVRVRMGLHTGEATLGRDGYVGIAVHRGERVCEAAHGGQILVSSATHAIVAADPPDGIGLREVGEVRLAGFQQAERLFQVVADGLPEAFAEPRAARPWRDEQPALLERAEELAAVDAAIVGAQSGAGKLVVIEGPAGIGKTSLLAEGRARAADSGVTVLYARASELEAAFSFGIVRQLFETAVGTAPEEAQSRLLGGAAAQAARLFTSGESLEGSEEDVYALLHGLYWLTVNLAESRPLALAVDDVQWSDAPSLRWLAYLARRLEGLPVCVLATLRPVEDEHPLLAELLADPATAIVRPNALSAPSVTELVRQELGADAEEEFCLASHRATGGNPLLLRELLRTLADQDIAPAAASVAVVERLAPDAVTRSVRLRLGRLPTEAARLARGVAVLGDRVEREHAAALAELERRQIAPAAAALARVDLLRPEPPFSFVHPLVGNAVYESIPSQEREAEHARAAELLAERNAPAEQVAAQLLLAPPESVPRAVELLRDAADLAAAEAGLESAARYLTRALEEPLGDDERGELLLELSGVEANLGAPTVIAHLREALSLVREQDQQAEVSLALGNALYWAGDEEEGVEVLERALAEHAELDIELRHRLEAELVVNATRVPSQYVRVRERLARLDVSLDEGPGARVLLAGQAYHEAVGGGDAARAAATALAALAAMSDEERARNYTGGAYALLHTDRLDDGIGLLDATLIDVRRRGAAFRFSGLSMTRAIFQYVRAAPSSRQRRTDAPPLRRSRTRTSGSARRRTAGWRRSWSSVAPSTRPRGCSTRSRRPCRRMRSRGRRCCALARSSRPRAATTAPHSRTRSSWGRRCPPSATPIRLPPIPPGGRSRRSSTTRWARPRKRSRWSRKRSSSREHGEHPAHSAARCGSSASSKAVTTGSRTFARRSRCSSRRRRGSSTPTPSRPSAQPCGAPTTAPKRASTFDSRSSSRNGAAPPSSPSRRTRS
jgi:class 3 adenylate cyclase